MRKPFTISGRVRSIRFAVAGLWTMLCSQHNAWIHAAATIAVCVVGALFGIGAIEWCAVSLAVAVVWTAEGLNTAFEFLADAAHPEFNPLVKKSKDVAAGAVLISSIGAAAVGALVFIPHFTVAIGKGGLNVLS